MTERIVTHAWWLATMLLICLTGAGTTLCAYRGVFSTFAGTFVTGAIYLMAAFPLGAACYLLCRHRNDLVSD